MEKKTIVINYPVLRLGGIERYLADLMQYSVDQGYRVVWITNKREVESSFFKEISNDPRVEKIIVRHSGFAVKYPIKFSDDEYVTMLSFEPLFYYRAEIIRYAHRNVAAFNHFLVLPHFTGNWYYPERFFDNRVLHYFAKRFFEKCVVKLNENDSIRAFSYQHLEAYEQNYNISILNKENHLLKRIQPIAPFNSSLVKKHAEERKEIFNIVTCARLDFPHKGYLIGLIDDVHHLRQKYKHIHLYIIGYGKGRDILESKIQKYCEQDYIHILGALPPQKARQVFYGGHLNIGLSGGLTMGATCGLPSLAVRHYTNACETYGFLSDNPDKSLSTEPGVPIGNFVKKSLECPVNVYCEQCEKDYNLVANKKETDPEYFFKQKNKDSHLSISFCRIVQAIFWNFLCRYECYVHKKNGYLDNK